MRYVISILISVGFVFAARPFMTDDYGVVGDNVVEFEMGHDYTIGRTMESYIAIKHGLSRKAELDLALSYNYPGLSALNMSLKLWVVDMKNMHYTLNFGGDWGDEGFDINNIVSFEMDRFLLNLNVTLISSLSMVEVGLSPLYEINKKVWAGGDIRYNLDSGEITALAGFAVELPPFIFDIAGGYEKITQNFQITSGLVFDL